MRYKHITKPLTEKLSIKGCVGDQITTKYHDMSIIETPPLTNIVKGKNIYLQAA